MAHWQKKEPKFVEMNRLIVQQPGLTQAELARLLKTDRSTIARSLPGMAEIGILLYEDDEGRLYPFDDSTVDG